MRTHRAVVPAHGFIDQPPPFFNALGLGDPADEMFGPETALVFCHAAPAASAAPSIISGSSLGRSA
jgi:hypothetical protein